MEDSEIDTKLRSLESELEEMKRRTHSILHESTSFPVQRSEHASLVASLVDRTPAKSLPSSSVPLAFAEAGSLDYRLERDAQDRKLSDVAHALSLERSGAAAERQRRAQTETELEIARRRVAELEGAMVEVRRSSESEILSLRSEMRSLQQEISVLDAALAERREGQTDALNRKFLEAEISAHHAHRVEAERRAEAAERNAALGRQEISDLSLRLAAAQEEVASAGRKFQNLEISSKNFQQIDAMRVEAESAVLRLRRELGVSEISRRDAETSLAQLFKELDERKTELKISREENFRFKNELESLKLKMHAEISDNKNLKMALDQMRHELKMAENRISDLNSQRTAAIRLQHDAIISDHLKFPIGPSLSPVPQSVPNLSVTQAPAPVVVRPDISDFPYSPRSEVSRGAAPPPWATHDEVSGYSEISRGRQRSEMSRDLGRGVAGVFGEAQREEEERKEMERELLELNIERQSIESWLGKIPLNSSGRTVHERKEKQSKEFRLSCVDARIAQIKQTLRKRRQLI